MFTDVPENRLTRFRRLSHRGDRTGPSAGARCGVCPADTCRIGAGCRALSTAPRSPVWAASPSGPAGSGTGHDVGRDGQDVVVGVGQPAEVVGEHHVV